MVPEEFFDAIEKQFSEELPFVAYRKPNDTKLNASLQDDATLYHISDFTESGFVFAPFDDSAAPILIPISHSKNIQTEFITSLESKITHDYVAENQEPKQFHLSLVQKGIDAIKNNEFQKVVLSRKEHTQLENSNPIKIFNRLLNTYPTAFVYCFSHPKVGIWLGATPETFLKIEGNRLTTMALAGTQTYDGKLEVAWKSKEKEEQQFVTDFIVKSLESSFNKLNISEVETVKAGNLLHLKTEITATFKPADLDLKHIIQRLHPTPAVCGLPKEKAKQFILNNENYPREFYTGFLGELNFKEKTSRNSNRHNIENNAYASLKSISNLYVNLRCLQLKDNQAIVYVGGGITKDSIPENEWEETVSKSQVVKSIL